MKIRPILFSTPMVEAILNGRKTQTRRIIKPHPEWKEPFWLYGGTIWHINNIPNTSGQGFQQNMKIKQGDILWVRETWSPTGSEEYLHKETHLPFFYKAGIKDLNKIKDVMKEFGYKWKPSIYMPKAACRIFLEVTNVRVERLHDISEDAAIAEGVIYDEGFKSYNCYLCDKKGHKAGENLCEDGFFDNAFESFRSLWQSINGKESWEVNPFVFVYEFKRVEKPENFLV